MAPRTTSFPAVSTPERVNVPVDLVDVEVISIGVYCGSTPALKPPRVPPPSTVTSGCAFVVKTTASPVEPSYLAVRIISFVADCELVAVATRLAAL